ncbi:MAG: IMP dehydrogenase [Desulfobacterales bacterium]
MGAAVGVGTDMEERADGLVKAGVDVLLIDTSSWPFRQCDQRGKAS